MSYSKSNANSKKLSELMNEEVKEVEKVVKKKSGIGINYPRFDLKPFGSQITAQQFRDKLLAIRKPDRRGNMTPVVRAAVSLSLPYNHSTFTFTYPDSRSSADETMYKALVIAGFEKYYKPTELMFRSNGTRDGLLARMAKQLVVKNVNPDATSDYIISRLAEKLPVKSDYLWLNQIMKDDPCFDNINSKADAGFPYIFEAIGEQSCPKVGGDTFLQLEYRDDKPVPLSEKSMKIVTHAFYWARKIWRIMDDAQDLPSAITNLAGFFDQYPELRTFLLKRKDEKMDRSDFVVKVRPYGCMPLPTRLFCSWAVGPWEQQVKNFVEDKNSISAYHFSPFYGGAIRLIEFFEYHYSQNKRKFFGISYGDDQLWCIRCADGSVIFLTPDVSAMDMNTQSDTIICSSKYIKKVFPNIPDMNHRCFVAAITMAFVHSFHVGGPFLMSKDQSLFSGVNATTLMNIENSGRIQVIVEDVVETFGEPITAKNVFKVIAKAFGVVKNVLGYTFKGFEAIGLEVANKNSDYLWEKYKGSVYSTEITLLRTIGLPLPFLSMKIVVEEGKPLCVPFDQYKLGASLVLPANSPEKKKIQYELERIVGIAFSGAWYDDKFLKFLQELYLSQRKLEKVDDDLLTYSELNSVFEEDVEDVIESIGLTSIPDRQFFVDLNFMSKPDFLKKYKGTNNTHAVDVKASIDSATGKSTSSSSKEQVESFTSTYSELVEELKATNINVLYPPLVDPKKGGNANALSYEGEKMKKIKREERWARERARRFMNSVDGSKKNFISNKFNIDFDDAFDLNEFDIALSEYEENFDDTEREAMNKYWSEEYNDDKWVDYRDEYSLSDDFGKEEEKDDKFNFGKYDYLNNDYEG